MTAQPTLKIDRIHHVAYRCKDAKETVNWYVDNLNMGFVLAIAEDSVPSTHEPDPYMHVFLDAGAGNVLAFFELPTKPEMGRDPNTPVWVQHIAFKVKDRDTLVAYKEKLEKKRASRCWASPTTRSSTPFISSIRTAIASNWPALTRPRRRCWKSSTR